MRLLNTRTGEFKMFENPQQVRYAILSHVWSKPDDRDAELEQTFQMTCQIVEKPQLGTPLSRYTQKIQRFCDIAQRDGFEWGWVDSSCIDKTSSSELSEAINSMYDWYRYAGVCYAFLQDLPDIDPFDPTFCDEFSKAKWFTRGWTLQELLAPSVLVFLSGSWGIIGSKYTLASAVEAATGINSSVLTFKQPLDTISVAHKMSWAAQRTTTRVEDEAYSLMGIFGVTIPISYGEGYHAFIRLQEQILKDCPDQTIFAWGQFLKSPDFRFATLDHVDLDEDKQSSNKLSLPPSPYQFLLASRPYLFKDSSMFQCLPRDQFEKALGIPSDKTYQEFPITPYGMRADLPLLTISRASDDRTPRHNLQPTHLALLACQDRDNNILALLLRPQHQIDNHDFVAGAVIGDAYAHIAHERNLLPHYRRITSLSREQVASYRQDIRMVLLYIPHCPSIAAQKLDLEAPTHTALYDSRERFEVRISGWSRALLAKRGYTVIPEEDINVAGPDSSLQFMPSEASGPNTTAVVIFNGNSITSSDECITLRIGRCPCSLATQFHLLAVAVSARGRSSPLDQKEIKKQHLKKDDPAHVQSWQFTGGFASKEVHLESASSTTMYPRRTITLRLTFSHDTQVPSLPKAYRLGVEILPAPPPFESPHSIQQDLPMEPPLSTNRKLSRTYSQVVGIGSSETSPAGAAHIGRPAPLHSATYQWDPIPSGSGLPQSPPGPAPRGLSYPVYHVTGTQWDGPSTQWNLLHQNTGGRPQVESAHMPYDLPTRYGVMQPYPSPVPGYQPGVGRGAKHNQAQTVYANGHGRTQQFQPRPIQENGRGRGQQHGNTGRGHHQEGNGRGRGQQLQRNGRGQGKPLGNTQYSENTSGDRGRGWRRS